MVRSFVARFIARPVIPLYLVRWYEYVPRTYTIKKRKKTDAAQLKTVGGLRDAESIITSPPQLTAVAPRCPVGPSYSSTPYGRAHGAWRMARCVHRLQRGLPKTKQALFEKT